MAVLLISALLALAGLCAAGEPSYDRDPTTWSEQVQPADRVGRLVWHYAANYSQIEWRVYTNDGHVRAQLANETSEDPSPRPSFDVKVGKFHKPSAAISVDDGWLVGFNEGEFGAALYWFGRDGGQHYRVSDHKVVEFLSTPDGALAIEGLSHLASSEGSLIRIVRAGSEKQWKAETVLRLPFAPEAVSRRRDGSLLITLSHSLVEVTPDRRLRTIIHKAAWGNLYCNSSVLTTDERTLYIGMRQYVAEVALETRNVRFLIPDKRFLNRLPEEVETRIRRAG